jgi:hypothetical protein
MWELSGAESPKSTGIRGRMRSIFKVGILGRYAMSSPPSTGSDYAYVPVSPEFRDRLRIKKAKEGVSYETYLREQLSLEE